MSDFAEELFSDVDPHRPDAPVARFYPGSKQRIPDEPKPPPPRPVSDKPWDRNPRRLMVGGEEHEFFTIGALAEALNRQAVTIRKWEERGVIPKARYRSGGKVSRRLYSRRQVEGLVLLCAKHGILEFNARPDSIPGEFTDDVITLWKEDL